MSTAPTLNGQIIGMTHYATRALLLRVLDTVEMSFEQSVVLGIVAASDTPIDRDDVVSRTTSGLKVSERAVLETLAQLEADGLVSAGSAITATDAGRTRQQFIREHIESITEALYGDLPAGDLAVVGRILTTVTERANSMLDR
jgi:hypothetical protein